jgi:hypothetical protein
MDGFISHQNMRRARVSIGVDRHGLDTHLLGRAHDTTRNFATVRDQDLGDWHSLTFSPDEWAFVMLGGRTRLVGTLPAGEIGALKFRWFTKIMDRWTPNSLPFRKVAFVQKNPLPRKQQKTFYDR